MHNVWFDPTRQMLDSESSYNHHNHVIFSRRLQNLLIRLLNMAYLLKLFSHSGISNCCFYLTGHPEQLTLKEFLQFIEKLY